MRHSKLTIVVGGMILLGAALLSAAWAIDDRQERVSLDQVPPEVLVAAEEDNGEDEESDDESTLRRSSEEGDQMIDVHLALRAC